MAYKTGKPNGSPQKTNRNHLHFVAILITITLLAPTRAISQIKPITTSTPLPDAPETLPIAHVIRTEENTLPVTIESDTQAEQAGHYTLDGHVVITYRGRTVEADHIEYDRDSGDLTATGHLTVSGGPNQEHLTASHGTVNLPSQTGRFYDVTGSVGLKTSARGTVYTNGQPFLFSGRLVVRTGPQTYDIYDGTVTSCQLPRPDWLLSAAHFNVTGDKARATNSVFRVLNLPLLYLPYVTHPTDANERQSGFLIPIFGQSSVKGIILGESIYLVLNRSADLTLGAEYFSSRGFAQFGSFRYRGRGLDFVTAHYSGLLDRRPPGITNQGGEDILAAGRRDFTPNTRVAANIEYLSSYVYRQAFAESFNTAVTSDVVSTAFLTHQSRGFESAAFFDRYQGIKLIQLGTSPSQQVRLFRAPQLQFTSTDHHFLRSNLQYTLDASTSGLKRTQPNFATGGIVERFDFHPELAYPLAFAGWHLRPAAAVRETVYSRGRFTGLPAGSAPQESKSPVNRADFEAAFEVRPPVLARTFIAGPLTRLIHSPIRHTIEPELTYRYTTGVDNFSNLLRFDATDVVSNTNELEYGVTQRLFLRHHSLNCPSLPDAPGFGGAEDNDEMPAAIPESTAGCSSEELISWRLTQKYFFDQSFGKAVILNRRNIFSTTLALSGVAFLTEPRAISPLISRLRLRTSSHTDVEWDFDYDTGAGKFTSSNLFLDLHRGNTFSALSYARLDAPGRFYTEGVSSLVSRFNQLRLLLGYGQPTKPGLSIAANAGLDLNAGTTTTLPLTNASNPVTSTQTLLQYAALQTSYNFNCCGFSVEYRKYELGSVRNEGAYRFNFTLANIGTAGNLRRAERLF